MILVIDYHSGVPVYRQIIEQVREQIMSGLLKEGNKMMSVRELSAKLSINPMTVSKAYSAMESEGLLERRRGIGLFVIGIDPRQKEKTKEVFIEELLNKAIVAAMQYGFPREKIQKILDKLFLKYQTDNRRGLDQ